MPATHATAELAVELRPRLARLGQLLRREAQQLPLSVTQSAVLGLLAADGPQRVTDLARAEGVAVPTMTQLVARLEARGDVRKASAPEDGRIVRVEITDQGRAIAEEVRRRRNDLLARRLEALSPEERRRLADALSALDRLLEPPTET